MIAHGSLIIELEDSIRHGSRDKRVDSLRKITNLFLADVDRLNDKQVNVFDDVLCHLIDKIETRALAELSQSLAPIQNAPNETLHRLARHEQISVAGPVLTQSPRLSTSELVEIANVKGQAHLLAIAGRAHIDVPLSDVLVRRGGNDVLTRLVKNAGAHFSEGGFATLIDRADGNESLAIQIGRRLDIPWKMFRELLQRATEAVRAKLIAMARPEAQGVIQKVLEQIANDVGTEVSTPRNFSHAHKLILLMKEKNELNEETVRSFVRGNKYEELVAALSVMCGLPFDIIDRLMHSERGDSLLIPCKAAGFEWATVRNILKNRPAWKVISEIDLEKAWADYINLSKTTAERVNRFWQVKEKVKAE
jgi:uncharacterized protein (DUF2336 family)